MRTYAYVYDGVVYEIIPPALYDDEAPGWQEGDPSRIGQEKPIETRYTAEFLSTTYDITDLNPMPNQGWTWDGTAFHAPVQHVPTPQEIAAQREAYRTQLKNQASIAMAPILVSLNLGDATDDETTKAKAWQSYYRELEALEISGTGGEPEWPAPPNI